MNFKGSQGSCHGNQNQVKITQICTDFGSVQDIWRQCLRVW